MLNLFRLLHTILNSLFLFSFFAGVLGFLFSFPRERFRRVTDGQSRSYKLTKYFSLASVVGLVGLVLSITSMVLFLPSDARDNFMSKVIEPITEGRYELLWSWIGVFVAASFAFGSVIVVLLALLSIVGLVASLTIAGIQKHQGKTKGFFLGHVKKFGWLLFWCLLFLGVTGILYLLAPEFMDIS